MRKLSVPCLGLLMLCMPLAGGADEALDRAAAALIDALPEEQREAASWPFSDAEREDIHFAPLFLDGVAHGALADDAATQAEALLAATLSARGAATVRTIRELENAVRRSEDERFWGFLTRRMRDPGRYLLAVFGAPSAQSAWGFRYEGHHLSLNLTSVPGATPATTPLFLGAQPRKVPEGWPNAGAAVLGEEESLARAIHAGLPAPLRAEASLPYDGGRGHLRGQVARVLESLGSGLARGDMPAEQRAQLDALVERFFGVFSERLAAPHRERLDAAGRDSLRFAFVAAERPANAFYARVEGPTLLIEIDNTSDGDHVHAVWHDRVADFGDDLLARHLREAHDVEIADREAGALFADGMTAGDALLY